jgi:hypothetical protein
MTDGLGGIGIGVRPEPMHVRGTENSFNFTTVCSKKKGVERADCFARKQSSPNSSTNFVTPSSSKFIFNPDQFIGQSRR